MTDDSLRILGVLKSRLRTVEAERERQYWAFTRTARGKPVDPCLTTEVAWLEDQISAIVSWLLPVMA
jgi:hypothetical protein